MGLLAAAMLLCLPGWAATAPAQPPPAPDMPESATSSAGSGLGRRSATRGGLSLEGPPKTEAALLAILSRAATVSAFLNPGAANRAANTTDTVRMLQHTGARYAGRSVFVWGSEGSISPLTRLSFCCTTLYL